MYRCKLYIIFFFFALFLTACQHEKTEKKTLTIYAGLGYDHAIKAIEIFEKETGIQVNHIRLSSGDILEKIKEEREQPKASVWFGGPADTLVQAKELGLLQPYKSPSAQMIPSLYKDPEGYWTGIYIGSLAIVTNKKWIQDVGLSIPHSWKDLLQPEFKGMISVPDPRTSGTAYTFLSTLVQLWGEEKAFNYLEKLHEQVRDYPSSGILPVRSVAMGEVGIAVTFAHDAIKLLKEGFPDHVITFPEEGTGYEIGAIGIILGAPNLEEAKMFVDWALGKQAQEIGVSTGNYQLLTNEHAVSPEESISLSDLQVIEYDFDWGGKNRERLIEKWEKTILID